MVFFVDSGQAAAVLLLARDGSQVAEAIKLLAASEAIQKARASNVSKRISAFENVLESFFNNILK